MTKRTVKKAVAKTQEPIVQAPEVEVVEGDTKVIEVVWSCISGRPNVSFKGEWTRRDVRITLNSILRAHHLHRSRQRKEAMAALAAQQQVIE